MTNYNERLDEILSELSSKGFDAAFNNPDDYMVVLLKSEAEAKQAITSLIKELVEEAIKKPHILPKNAQHQESVKQGINFYHRQMRKRVDKLKEEL